MNSFGNKLRKTCVAAAIAASFGFAGTAQADRIQLGFILDGSGSITAGEWTTIVNGLASAINLIPVGGSDTYEVSVVQFSTNASTYAQASNILITDSTVRGNLASFVAGLTQLGNNTNYEIAFNAMKNVLNNTIAQAAYSYVNFATDGEPNTCGLTSFTSPGLAGSQACAVSGLNAMLGIGVDNVSIEGIGVSASAKTFLTGSICTPQPCDDTAPFNFPTQGFYVGVANATEYATAVENKVRTVTGQIPEPATLALMGVALAGIGFARRREKA